MPDTGSMSAIPTAISKLNDWRGARLIGPHMRSRMRFAGLDRGAGFGAFSITEIDRAKKYFAEGEYDSCALQLRKGCENLLKSYLSPEEQLNRKGEELDFSGMLDRAKSKCAELRELLERLDSDRTYILNRLCHDDHGKVYSGELRNAIVALETLEGLLK